MNNDLISRNALIQHAYSAVVDGVEKDIIDLSDVDNAPTVELDESVIREVLNKRCMTAVTNEYLIALHGKRSQGEQIAWEQGYECGKNERPQGEWVVKSNGTTNYYACNKCGSAGDIQDKFCRECGADMRKGE